MCHSTKCVFIITLILLSVSTYAFDGDTIISNAETYRDQVWTCEIRNARPENSDNNNYLNNDTAHPFYPLGAAIGKDAQDNIIHNQDNTYTGIPYASGLRDTAGGDGIFSEKIDDREPGYLAGNTDEGVLFLPPLPLWERIEYVAGVFLPVTYSWRGLRSS